MPRPRQPPKRDWLSGHCVCTWLHVHSCGVRGRDGVSGTSALFSPPCDPSLSFTPLPFYPVCWVCHLEVSQSFPKLTGLLSLFFASQASSEPSRLLLSTSIRLPPVSTGHLSDHATISCILPKMSPKTLASWPAAISPIPPDLTCLALHQCPFQTSHLSVSSLKHTSPQRTSLLDKLIISVIPSSPPILCKLMSPSLLQRPGRSNDLPQDALHGYLYPQVHLQVISLDRITGLLSPQKFSPPFMSLFLLPHLVLRLSCDWPSPSLSPVSRWYWPHQVCSWFMVLPFPCTPLLELPVPYLPEMAVEVISLFCCLSQDSQRKSFIATGELHT